MRVVIRPVEPHEYECAGQVVLEAYRTLGDEGDEFYERELSDVGAFADTFDLETGEFISSEITVNKGPHPEADSDFTLFCEVISEALA